MPAVKDRIINFFKDNLWEHAVKQMSIKTRYYNKYERFIVKKYISNSNHSFCQFFLFFFCILLWFETFCNAFLDRNTIYSSKVKSVYSRIQYSREIDNQLRTPGPKVYILFFFIWMKIVQRHPPPRIYQKLYLHFCFFIVHFVFCSSDLLGETKIQRFCLAGGGGGIGVVWKSHYVAQRCIS